MSKYQPTEQELPLLYEMCKERAEDFLLEIKFKGESNPWICLITRTQDKVRPFTFDRTPFIESLMGDERVKNVLKTSMHMAIKSMASTGFEPIAVLMIMDMFYVEKSMDDKDLDVSKPSLHPDRKEAVAIMLHLPNGVHSVHYPYNRDSEGNVSFTGEVKGKIEERIPISGRLMGLMPVIE